MRIRLKLAILFTSATLVLLLGAGVLFVGGLRSGLQNSMDNSLSTRADEIIAELNRTSAGDERDAVLTVADATFAQVLDTTGAVLASTSPSLTQPLLTRAQAVAASRKRQRFDIEEPSQLLTGPDKDPRRFRVLAIASGRAGIVVAVTTSRDVVDEAVERAAKELLLVGAVVLLMAGPGAWLLTRSALTPVERMRAQAAQLQTQDAGGGLTVPDSKDEIARLGETLNGLLGRLHDALERERAFVADAGHELRTPLTVLRGELELARRPGRSAAELHETVEVAAEETERLIRLAEDLLVLARTDQQAPATLAHDIDLLAVARAASTAVAAAAQARDVTVVFSSEEPAPLAVPGDPQRLRQAVENLLVNAVRFSPVGGTVRVETGVDHGLAEISVIDSGPGFGADFLPVAFERFRRGDVARTRAAGAGPNPTGAGLGLAIVRSIMRTHNGTATAQDLDHGARVTLRWPI